MRMKRCILARLARLYNVLVAPEGSIYYTVGYFSLIDMCHTSQNLYHKGKRVKICTVQQLASLLSSWLCRSSADGSAVLPSSLSLAATFCFTRRGLTTSRRPLNRMSSSCDSALCADSSFSNSMMANRPCTAHTAELIPITDNTNNNNNNNSNNNNNHNDIYSAVIMAEPLLEFTRFTQWIQKRHQVAADLWTKPIDLSRRPTYMGSQ